MPAILMRWGRGGIALAALILLAACSYGREPAYDAAIAGELAALTAETQRLFQDLAPETAAPYGGRAERYRGLLARAETVRLMAEARGIAQVPVDGLAPRLARRLDAAATVIAERASTLPGLGELASVTASELAEYRDATPTYMADYLRNLARLEAEDRGATGDQAARIAAYESALAAHEAEMQRYLDAFRAWQAGQGAQPAAPVSAPVAPDVGLDPLQVALRRAAIEDILRDALVYERDILNRNR